MRFFGQAFCGTFFLLVIISVQVFYVLQVVVELRFLHRTVSLDGQVFSGWRKILLLIDI